MVEVWFDGVKPNKYTASYMKKLLKIEWTYYSFWLKFIGFFIGSHQKENYEFGLPLKEIRDSLDTIIQL